MSNQYQQPPSEWKYWAFISYSHADEKWADWLHRALETYNVPKPLVGKPTKYGAVPKRPYPVFRDRDELPSSADLGDKLTEALWRSRYLIVVCSPRSVASQWVNEEIKKFKSMGREDQVLCLIVDGEPYASHNPALGLEECFPEPVRYRVDAEGQLTDMRTEPIAADARKGKDGKPNSRLKLISGMFGVNFSDLKQRDHERQQQRLKIILAGISFLLILFLFMAVSLYFQKKEAVLARKVAETSEARAKTAETNALHQAKIARVNARIAKEQEQIAKENEAEAIKERIRAEENERAARAAEEATRKALEEVRKQKEVAERERQRAEEQREIAEMQREIAVQNEKVANEQRRRAVAALSASSFNEASRFVNEGDEATALAYLAKSLDWDSSNTSAKARMLSLFSEINWPLPRVKPLMHETPVRRAVFSPDGGRLATVSGNQAQVYDLSTGEPTGAPMTHRYGILGADFSFDGSRLVTASDDGTAQIWDAATGKATGIVLKHDHQVKSARFDPEGKKVITASQDKTARIWNAESGEMLHTLDLGGIVWAAGFSPNGEYAVVTFENNAQVFSVATGAPVGQKLTHEGGVFSAEFSPDSKRVVTGSGDKTLRVWDASTGAPVTGPLPHEDLVNSVRFSPDGLRVVSASRDRTARIWDASSGEPIGQTMQHNLPVNHAEFSPNGRWVATASDDRTGRVWDAATGTPILEPIKFDDIVNHVEFSPDGGLLAFASNDKSAQVWTTIVGKPLIQPFSHEPFAVNHAAFSHDNRLLVTCSDDRTARVWDVATGRPVTDSLKHTKRVNYAEFSPDGKWLATCSEDGHVKVWEATTGKLVTDAIRHRSWVNFVHFSPDGKSVLTSSKDWTAAIWELPSGEPRFSEAIRHKSSIYTAEFSPDGKYFVTASHDRTAVIRDAKTGKQVVEVKHDSPIRHARFSPDGQWIATASEDRTARVWEAKTGKPVGPPLRHDGAVNWVDFSPNGSLMLVTACDDFKVRVFRSATGDPVTEPLVHENRVTFAEFSRDGQLVITCGYEDIARVWESSSWRLVARPLKHDRRVNAISLSQDASFVVTASADNTAKVWQLALPGAAPAWLPELAVTVGGLRLGEGGGTELIRNAWKRIEDIQGQMAKLEAGDPYVEWIQWFLADRDERTISYYADLKVPDFVKAKVRSGGEAALEEALNIDPDNGLALAKLGLASNEPARADFLTGLGIQYEPKNYEALWLRGAVLQRQDRLADAFDIMQRAIELDPRAVAEFGPEGGEFTLANAGEFSSSGWLPAGWLDNSREASLDVTYSRLNDAPLGVSTAVRIAAAGQRGSAEMLGPRFLVRQGGTMVIEGYVRSSSETDITFYARQFIEPQQIYVTQPVRTSKEWKPFKVNVPARDRDLAAEVMLRFTSYARAEVDIAGVRVVPR